MDQRITSFRFTTDTLNHLKALAADDRRSASNYLEVLIEREYAAKFADQPTKEAA
jgi:predicted DNA-binding protein